MDHYQEAYSAHQARKRETLIQLLEERHSERMFSDEPVDMDFVDYIRSTFELAPSSCNRHGIMTTVEIERDRKALLGGLLVGGVGWIHRAPTILMLFGDPLAYKAGEEQRWMPYIDTGIIVHQVYLLSTTLGLKACYVNPNVRDFNRPHFDVVFSPTEDAIYCGSIAIGWPREKEL